MMVRIWVCIALGVFVLIVVFLTVVIYAVSAVLSFEPAAQLVRNGDAITTVITDSSHKLSYSMEVACVVKKLSNNTDGLTCIFYDRNKVIVVSASDDDIMSAVRVVTFDQEYHDLRTFYPKELNISDNTAIFPLSRMIIRALSLSTFRHGMKFHMDGNNWARFSAHCNQDDDCWVGYLMTSTNAGN